MSARELDLAADACIDDQRRRMGQGAVSFALAEGLVREYCYCMAPFLADLSPSVEDRARLIATRGAVKARVQRLDDGCRAGVNSGRRFAP